MGRITSPATARRSRLAVTLACAVLPLTACAGFGRAVPSTVVVTSTVPAPAGTSTGTTAAGTTAVSPPGPAVDATVADLRSAHLLAGFSGDPDRPEMTLHDGSAQVDRFACALDRTAPVLADIDADGLDEAVSSMTCSGGSSDWPGEVIAVKAGGAVVVDYSLYRKEGHTTVRSLTAVPGGVDIEWQGFDHGATTPPTSYAGTLRLFNGTPVFVARRGGPTTAAPTPTPTPTAPSAVGRITQVTGPGAGFISPTGGLVCALSDTHVRCDATGATFAAPPKPAGCQEEWGFSLVLEPGKAGRFACVNDPAYAGGDSTQPPWWMPGADPRVSLGQDRPGYGLAYGHTLASTTMQCVVEPTNGVTCRSNDGRHGFTLSKNRYRTW